MFGLQVSLLFLLIADDNVRAKLLLQQLIVASFSKEKSTAFIQIWALENEKGEIKWRDKLLEGLCIIQAKRVIAKLGLSYYDLEPRFMPRNVNSSLFIHPIVKLLYFVCENLTVNESKSMINDISLNYANVNNFNYSDDGEYLEMYFLYWIWQRVVSVGSRVECARKTCNLEPVIACLKQMEKDSLKETVKEVCNRFNNFTSKIHTDDKLATNIDSLSCSFYTTLSTPSTSKHYYTITREKAGIVLIINQMHFTRDTNNTPLLSAKPLETRHGTEQDTKALKNTFSSFGYRVIIRENISKTEILSAVQHAVNQSVSLDSIIVCILSHGYKGIVYGSDSIPVAIEDIERILCTDRLISKPKILIIQACQGEETQQAKYVSRCTNPYFHVYKKKKFVFSSG